MRVLICGGGVIGAAIAYYLSRRGARAVVIERTDVACAASGKSGGFLALDWCDGTPLEALARRSFALHARLAEEIGEDGGYRRLDTFGGAIGPGADRARVSWLSDRISIRQRLGSPETTAQVHPARFTRALMRAAEAKGAELRIGQVSGVLRDSSGESVVGVQVDGEELLGDAVVVAMGPWSILAAAWLPMPAVFGLKGHSILFNTGGAMPAEALFLEMHDQGDLAHGDQGVVVNNQNRHRRNVFDVGRRDLHALWAMAMVVGSHNSARGPRPSSLVSRSTPPSCSANPWTIERPRPVPLPNSFVEKNGSVAFPMSPHSCRGPYQ